MKLSNLQTTNSKSWGGMTTKNHLANIWKVAPQVATSMIGKMLAQSYGTSLDTMLSELPVKTLESDDDFTWKLMGHSDTNVALVEARFQGSTVTATDVNVGQGGADFELVFSTRRFSETELIVGEKNEQYPIQIQEEYQEGTNTVYRCTVWGSAANLTGIPGEELVSGKLFSSEYAPVEESFSIRGSELNFTSPSTFRNTFTRIRKQYTVPGNMVNRKVVGSFEFLDKNGTKQSMTTWLQYQAFEFEQQIMQDKNRAMYFGRTTLDVEGNISNDGKSGQGIRAGYGLREQMEVSNTHFYTKFTYDLITNILTELAEGKLGMDERKFVLRTGERGATLVHKAVRQEASGWSPLFDEDAQKKVSSKLHPNSRQYGFQYTEFIAPNNIYVRVEVDPMYSDPIRNKIQAPNNGHFFGGLAEAYRMDIFDIGTADGEPNMQKVISSADPEITGYINGMRDPYSPSGAQPKQIVTSVDGFEVHKMCTFAVMLRDPSRTASLIPSILA
jgi:hypothetical protein